MWWWRVRYCTWWTLLVLITLYCAALIAGGCVMTVREWRSGHRVAAVSYPLITVGFYWAVTWWRKKHPTTDGT